MHGHKMSGQAVQVFFPLVASACSFDQRVWYYIAKCWRGRTHEL